MCILKSIKPIIVLHKRIINSILIFSNNFQTMIITELL